MLQYSIYSAVIPNFFAQFIPLPNSNTKVDNIFVTSSFAIHLLKLYEKKTTKENSTFSFLVISIFALLFLVTFSVLF